MLLVFCGHTTCDVDFVDSRNAQMDTTSAQIIYYEAWAYCAYSAGPQCIASGWTGGNLWVWKKKEEVC